MNLDELRAYLYEQGTAWLRKQPARYRAQAKRIERQRVEQLEPFFGEDVRRARVAVARIEDPPFYPDLLKRGVDHRDLLYFSSMEAITFDDVIVLKPGGQASLPLLFHELVHVTQYRLLGLDAFARTYIDGWFAARDAFLSDPMRRYRFIPHEAIAYDLAERYAAAPATVFVVEPGLRALPVFHG